jgi:excisionase family DNA binding protein
MTHRTSKRQIDRDSEAAAFGQVRGRHHRHSGLPKYHTIKAVAESLDVSQRTVRRWIANGDLIVHRVEGVVRIAERDLRAFLAQHREG